MKSLTNSENPLAACDYRSGSLKQKYSRLSEVSQLLYRPARLHRLHVAWRASAKSANLALASEVVPNSSYDMCTVQCTLYTEEIHQ